MTTTSHRVAVNGDWVPEGSDDRSAPTAFEALARGNSCLIKSQHVEALRQFGVALLLEPEMPRAHLGAAIALEALGYESRAREYLSAPGLSERLTVEGLISGLQLASRRAWRTEALDFVVHAYQLRPSPADLEQLNELVTVALDQLAPDVADQLRPAMRPIRVARAGRNDPCPCGSGRKYKRCCLKKDEESRGPAVRGEADNLAIVAVVRERSGDWAGAAALWDYLTGRYPDVAAYWLQLGRARLALDQGRLALAAFERLDRFSPALWEDAAVDRARAYSQLGRRRDALRMLDTHPRAVLGSASATVLRAELLIHLGRLVEGRDDLLRAVRLVPDQPDYAIRLAEAQQALGDLDAAGGGAIRVLDMPAAQTADESGFDPRLRAAAILAGLGRETEQVLSVCADALASQLPPDLKQQAYSVRAYALLSLGRPAETAAAVEEALVFGDSVELYLLGAAAASQLGDAQARATYLREGVRCLEADSEVEADELAIGGLIAATLGQFDRALVLVDRALAGRPDSELALPVRAHSLLRLDRAEDALATTRSRRATELSSPLLVLTRAEALGRLGRHAEALVELLGPLPVETGPLAPLLGQLQEVPASERRELLRGREMRHLDREAEALETLRGVAHRNPRYADAWQELATLYLERGDARDAHQALLEAERLDPGNPRLREQMAHVEGMLRAAQRSRAEAESAVVKAVGREAWLSLSEATRLTLVSAEVSWRQSRRTDGLADYGAAVGQWARAVELELQRRLFAPFRELLTRTESRDRFVRDAAEDSSPALLPFLRFLRSPQGGLSLGPMLAVADATLAVGDADAVALARLRRFIQLAYQMPSSARELLAEPELRILNATRNQGLHRSTVGWDAANRCRQLLLGQAAGQGWLTASTRHLAPRPIEELVARWER